MKSNTMESLQKARWQTIFHTYGSSHATLIGTLVDWWVSTNPRIRYALEGGPGLGFEQGASSGIVSDILLVENGAAIGVVEVEGTRYEYALEKIGMFFGTTEKYFQDVFLGIFLAYSTIRKIPQPPMDDFIARARPISKANPGKHLVILALDKRWDSEASGPRARNEYALGTPHRVAGAWIQDGELIDRRTIAQRHIRKYPMRGEGRHEKLD